MPDWTSTKTALQTAKGIAWDTCHKIYVLMDDEQMRVMKTYEYSPLLTADAMTPDEMLTTVQSWYEQSCFLRFIDAVHTVDDNPNEGFTTLIGQGDDDECEDCGMEGCEGVCNDYEDDSEDEE